MKAKRGIIAALPRDKIEYPTEKQQRAETAQIFIETDV